METFNKFHQPHTPDYDNFLNGLKKQYKSKKRKNNVNLYYFGLHFDDDTFCSNRHEIWKQHPFRKKSQFEYSPITLMELKEQQVRKKQTRSDKQTPHSETSNLIIEYLKNGLKNKEIVEKLKTVHGIITNSQNVSKIKRRFQIQHN